MPLASIPAADAAVCGNWTEQERDLYNHLDFYLAKMQHEHRKTWATWRKFFGKIKWTPNQGLTMRSVAKIPSPHIRQFAFPNDISQAAKKDIIQVRERKVDETVYWHKFESLVLDYLPSFRDFMDHVDDNASDIMEKEERFEDVYYRGRVLHASPNVFIMNRAAGELVAAPTGIGDAAGATAKSTAWLQAMIGQLGNPGYLSFEQLNKLVTVMETDLRVLPFKGSELPKQDQGMSNQFALVVSSEAYNQFTFDPWLLANKNCDLDVVNDRFRGSIFGRITTVFEDMPLRMKGDGTFVAPEIIEANPAADNFGETIPNPDYVSLTTSPYEWAFLVGAQGYDAIEVGPPPAAFASGKMPIGFGKMFWNGEIEFTKNILIPCPQDDGTILWEPNNYGDKGKFISRVTYGVRRRQPRNIVPILFKRKRGA